MIKTSSGKKFKIGFIAYTTKTLEIYWNALKDVADCWWGVTRPHIYNVLKEANVENVVYRYDELVIDENKKVGNRFVSTNPGHSERLIEEEIRPDMWIAEYPNNLIHIPKRAFWVQAFSAMPVKKYFFHPPLLNYDLILLPGYYHEQEMIKRLNMSEQDCEKLKVVGWPRVDCLTNKTLNREKIMKEAGLDPDKKTMLYAPTWGWGYGNDAFFARWFGREKEVFKQLCEHVKKKNLNFIVKLHGLSFQATNQELIDIADEYGVLWLTKETDKFTAEPNPYLWVSDILLSELSGIITEFLVLDRPIIYIDPDENRSPWDVADMPRHFRVGHVVRTPQELMDAVDDSLNNPQRFSPQRKELADKIYCSIDGKATQRAVEEIIKLAQSKIAFCSKG